MKWAFNQFHNKSKQSTGTDYYSSLFTSASGGNTQIVEESISPSISLAMNESLIKIPDDLEIKKAVFAIHGDKAPGPDGFSAKVFGTLWGGGEICSKIRDLFVSGQLQRHFNKTHVRLIPKIKSPKKVMDYRPIALCSTHYKIIAKILCQRLKPVLPTLVSPHQSAFVAGRSILDNVLITHEILHYLCTSSAKKHCSMAV